MLRKLKIIVSCVLLVSLVAGCSLLRLVDSDGGGDTQPEYNYLYIYAKNFTAKGEQVGDKHSAWTRPEGWADWLAPTSCGEVVTLHVEIEGWVEYALDNLPEGEYTVFVRALSLDNAAIKVIWNNTAVGEPKFAEQVTGLRWSLPVGTVQVTGQDVLRLQAVLNADYQYIDSVLLTDDPDFTPDNDYWEYESLL